MAAKLSEAKETSIKKLQELIGCFRFFQSKNAKFIARLIELLIKEAFYDLGVLSPTEEDFRQFAKVIVPLNTSCYELLKVMAVDLLDTLDENVKEIENDTKILLATDASTTKGGFLFLDLPKGHSFVE